MPIIIDAARGHDMKRSYLHSIIAALLIIALAPGASLAFQSDTSTGTESDPINPAIIQARSELDDLAKEIKEKEIEIYDLGFQLENSSKDIISSYQRLKIAEKALRDQQKVLNDRIVEVYKNRSNFIVLLLTSNSLRDLWTRMAFLSRVNQVDRGLLVKNREKLEEVDGIRRSISDNKEKLLISRRSKVNELAEIRLEFDKKKVKLTALADAAKPPKTVNSQTSFSLLGR